MELGQVEIGLTGMRSISKALDRLAASTWKIGNWKIEVEARVEPHVGIELACLKH
jgi:hypothetical protein